MIYLYIYICTYRQINICSIYIYEYLYVYIDHVYLYIHTTTHTYPPQHSHSPPETWWFWKTRLGSLWEGLLSGASRYWLVVSTHMKNITQIGSLPQIGVKIKNYLKPPRRLVSGRAYDHGPFRLSNVRHSGHSQTMAWSHTAEQEPTRSCINLKSQGLIS